jgi:hypothetical protein
MLLGVGNPVLDEDGFPIFEFTLLAENGLFAEDLGAFCEAIAPPA